MANVIEYSQFKKEYFKIYPSGREESAFEELNGVLNDPTEVVKNTDGSPRKLTFEDICIRYKDYCEKWDSENGEKLAKGYLSKGNEKKDPHSFLFDKTFREVFSKIDSNPARSEYLFGKDRDKLKREFSHFTNFVIRRKGAIPIINDIPPKEVVVPKKAETIGDVKIKPKVEADMKFDVNLNEKQEGEEEPF